MNMNKQMEDLGQIGTQGYSASDDVVSHLLAKTRRSRTLRQSGTTAAAAIGAMALGMLSMQAVAALRDEDPAHSKIDIVIDDDAKDKGPETEKSYTDPAKIEYLEASAQEKQEQLDKNLAEWEAKKAAEAAKKAEEEAKKKAEAEAKKKAEAEAKKKAEEAAKKDDGKDGMTKAECEAKYPYDKYEYKYFNCDHMAWKPKPGYMNAGGKYLPIVSMTDQATGQVRSGAYNSEHDKIYFADGDWGYAKQEGKSSWAGNTCKGIIEEKDGETCQWSCFKRQWIPIS